MLYFENVTFSNYVHINCKVLKIQNLVPYVILQNSIIQKEIRKKYFLEIYFLILRLVFEYVSSPFWIKCRIEIYIHSFKDFIRSCLSMPIVLLFFTIAFQSEVALYLTEFSPLITELVIDFIIVLLRLPLKNLLKLLGRFSFSWSCIKIQLL